MKPLTWAGSIISKTNRYAYMEVDEALSRRATRSTAKISLSSAHEIEEENVAILRKDEC